MARIVVVESTTEFKPLPPFLLLLEGEARSRSLSLLYLYLLEMSSISMLQARALSSAAASTTAPRRAVAMRRSPSSSPSAAATSSSSSRILSATLPSSSVQRGFSALPASPLTPSRGTGRRSGSSHVVAVSRLGAKWREGDETMVRLHQTHFLRFSLISLLSLFSLSSFTGHPATRSGRKEGRAGSAVFPPQGEDRLLGE